MSMQEEPANVGEAMQELEQLDRDVRAFYDDPMTHAMGAPTGDFQEAFDRSERVLAAFILEHSPAHSRRWRAAWGRMHRRSR